MTTRVREVAPLVTEFADQNVFHEDDDEDEQGIAVNDRGDAEEKENAALAFAGGGQVNIVAEQIFLSPGAEKSKGFLAEIVNIQELGESVVAVGFD